MAMTVSTMYPGIQKLLMGRTVSNADMAEAVRKSVLEFTESYRFPGLESSGPVVSLTPNTPNYNTSYFTTPTDGSIELNMMVSFWVFTDPYIVPGTTAYTGSNAGYNLTYKTIDRLEVLINTSGEPLHWSRHNGQIWIACNPDRNYNLYARYQHEHPFPNAGTGSAGTDTVFLPNSWQEIIEYASAERLAPNYNLSTKATEFHTRLHGSADFERSDGVSGTPGLIFQRTSQLNRDQSTSTKRFRLRMGRV